MRTENGIKNRYKLTKEALVCLEQTLIRGLCLTTPGNLLECGPISSHINQAN